MDGARLSVTDHKQRKRERDGAMRKFEIGKGEGGGGKIVMKMCFYEGRKGTEDKSLCKWRIVDLLKC